MTLYQKIFREWRDYSRQHPVIASLVLLGVLGGYFGGAYYLFREEKRSKEQEEKKRQENMSYYHQAQTLNNVQESLNNLIQFVEQQKQKLKESEDVVNSLKQEQEKLKPVVEADRRAVEIILDLQYQKSRDDVWRERAIGFGLGFIASVIASFVYGLLRSLSARNKTSAPSS